MPLDRQHPRRPRVLPLGPFDHAVLRPRARAERRRHIADRLVMPRVHARVPDLERAVQQRAGLDAQSVTRARIRTVHGAGTLARQVLVQRAAQGHEPATGTELAGPAGAPSSGHFGFETFAQSTRTPYKGIVRSVAVRTPMLGYPSGGRRDS